MSGAGPRPFLLFDLGGVLIDNVGFERLQGLLPHPMDPDALKARWLASPHVRAFELGRIEPDAFARGLVDDWQLRCTPDALIAEFTAWPRGFHDGALPLLAALRRTHRIGCLTNSNALHWARFDGFDGVFDVSLSLHRISAIKPDADCFARAIAACGGVADHILFFDDARPNVVAAREAGLQAAHVDGFAALRTALDRLGFGADR